MAQYTLYPHKLAHNFRVFKEHTQPAHCTAMLKCNALGLGLSSAGPALYSAGCRKFYVADYEEALQLRLHIPGDAEIHMLSARSYDECCWKNLASQNIFAVINSLEHLQVALHTPELPTTIRVNLGSNNLGLPPETIKNEQKNLKNNEKVTFLAQSTYPNSNSHPTNIEFLSTLMSLKSTFPKAKISLANTHLAAAQKFRLNEVRIGIGLWGSVDHPGSADTTHIQQELLSPVDLCATVLNITPINAHASVGYGSNPQPESCRVATVDGGRLNGLPFHRLQERFPISWGRHTLFVIPQSTSAALTSLDVGDAPISVGTTIPIVQSLQCIWRLSRALNYSHTELLYAISNAHPTIQYT